MSQNSSEISTSYIGNILKGLKLIKIYKAGTIIYWRLAVNNCEIKVAHDWIRSRALWYRTRPQPLPKGHHI